MLLRLKPASGQVLIAPGSTALRQGFGAVVLRFTNSATGSCPRTKLNEVVVVLPRDATTKTSTINAAVQRRRKVDVAPGLYSIAPDTRVTSEDLPYGDAVMQLNCS